MDVVRFKVYLPWLFTFELYIYQIVIATLMSVRITR